jgi:hypothetical protein
MNPYINPFLNPYMTQFPTNTNRTDTLLYFMAAQQATSGFGARTVGGSRPAQTTSTRQAPGPGPGASGARGYFNDNPTIDDRGGRLSRRFPTFGSNGGSTVAADRGPLTNEKTRRYFNRYSRSNPPNGR